MNDQRPKVLFGCVKNGGKSQMAAGFMKLRAGDQIDVHSAGTRPGTKINDLSAAALAEVGVDITGEQPKPITEHAVRTADLVVTLGREAHVEPVAGTQFENWDIDEPSCAASKEWTGCGWSATTSTAASRTSSPDCRPDRHREHASPSISEPEAPAGAATELLHASAVPRPLFSQALQPSAADGPRDRSHEPWTTGRE